MEIAFEYEQIDGDECGEYGQPVVDRETAELASTRRIQQIGDEEQKTVVQRVPMKLRQDAYSVIPEMKTGDEDARPKDDPAMRRRKSALGGGYFAFG